MNPAFMPMLFVVLWSTGFIGARLGLPDSEPMTFLALRFGIVAMVLVATVWVVGARWPSWRQWRQQSTVGLFNHVVYLGGVFVSIELGLEAGLSAVIVGLQPITIALGAGVLLGERLTITQWFGMALGFGGVLLIVVRKLDAGVGDMFSVGCSFVALAGISLGSILQKRYSDGIALLPGNMVQFSFAAVACSLFAMAFETRLISWTVEFTIALAWSVVVLSFRRADALLHPDPAGRRIAGGQPFLPGPAMYSDHRVVPVPREAWPSRDHRNVCLGTRSSDGAAKPA